MERKEKLRHKEKDEGRKCWKEKEKQWRNKDKLEREEKLRDKEKDEGRKCWKEKEK